MWIKRVTGGRDEIVIFHRLSFESRLDVPFEVSDEVGNLFVNDETGRFVQTTKPE